MPGPSPTPRRLARAARRRLRRLRRAARNSTTLVSVAHPRGAAEPAGPAAAGRVERFDRDAVAGWAPLHDGRPVRVGVYVNDLEVAAAWASDEVPGREDARGFQLRLRGIWDYVGPRDVLTLRVDGRPLPMPDGRLFRRPAKAGGATVRELRRRLADGYILGQTGRLQLSKKLDTEWQATVMGLYQRVRRLLADEYGHDVFLVYGTLLGAVREGSVIGHDVDFDCAYVSRARSGRAAAADLRDIGLFLVDQGLDVECRQTALHVHDATDPSIRIDLFHFFFDETDELAAPFGIAGTTVITREQWAGTKEIDFCGGRALVPSIDEAFVEHLYGATWRLPKPGFHWLRDRTRRWLDGVLPMTDVTAVLWENAYARRAPFPEPSSFCRDLLARPELPATVVDIGCGDGRDTAAFADTGRTAVGLDRSRRAVALGLARGTTARFEVCDIDAPDFGPALGRIRDGADGPVLFYLRFLVHAVDGPTEAVLLTELGRRARPGDLVAAEFRTERDKALPKTFGNHLRRYVAPERFDGRLRDAGFEILDVVDGTGLAPLGDEDPELHRVVACRR